MASAGPYANLHLAPDTNMPASHHWVFLQAGCPSCCPTNSVKALKVFKSLKWIQVSELHSILWSKCLACVCQHSGPLVESSWRHRRLRSELKALRADPLEGIQAMPLDRHCSHWQACITGPRGSPYEGGLFFLYLQIPHRWVCCLATSTQFLQHFHNALICRYHFTDNIKLGYIFIYNYFDWCLVNTCSSLSLKKDFNCMMLC